MIHWILVYQNYELQKTRKYYCSKVRLKKCDIKGYIIKLLTCINYLVLLPCVVICSLLSTVCPVASQKKKTRKMLKFIKIKFSEDNEQNTPETDDSVFEEVSITRGQMRRR